MSYAVLFSGQGSQHPDMLPWLETEPTCRDTLQMLTAHLGVNWRQKLRNPAIKSNNTFAQVLITGTALAAWTAIEGRLPEGPAFVAGYSVGELPAFGCAGVLSTAQAIDLAALRAQLMDQAVAHLSTGLLAVTGMSESAVLDACATLGLECAIRVGHQHAVFAGTDAALSQALPVLTALGAHCTRLEVRVASHSSWMTAAAQAYAKTLCAMPFAAPHCPLVLNALGQPSRQTEILRKALSQQLASTVQWSSVMDAIAERQISCVLEVGGGSALSRMWNERHAHIPARALDEFRNPQGAIDWISKRLTIRS
jgi:[acyl-carrier-protein] S-malonyltransferase